MIKANRLPNEYQEVEYIQTTGTQYIDTGIYGDTNIQIETSIEVTQTAQDKPVFGCYLPTTGGSSLGGYFHLTPYNSKWYYGGNGSEGNGGTYTNVVGTKYNIVFNNSNSEIVIDSTTLTPTMSLKGYSGTTIAISYRGTTNNKRVGMFKYFTFKIYDKTNNAYLRNFIPCYRKSDNEIGMYDLVSKQFFTNTGTGTLEKGNNVQVKVKTIKLFKNNNTNEIKYIKTRSKNLLNVDTITNYELPYTLKGVTYSKLSEGIIHTEGQKTEEGYATWGFSHQRIVFKANQTYYIAEHLTCSCNKLAGGWDANRSGKFTPTEDIYSERSYITTTSRANVSVNFDTYLMIVEGETKPEYYAPYMAKVFDQLPSDYQRVEYIQSDGSQYIDTGVYLKPNTAMNFDILFEDLNDARWFGDNNNIIAKNSNRFPTRVGGTWNDTYISAISSNTRYLIKWNLLSSTYTLYTNETLQANITKTATTETTYTAYMGSVNNSSQRRGTPKFKLYGFKIIQDNVLIRNMIPCYKKSNSEIGLYDIVNNVFYTNIGTGNFTKGNNI